MTVPHLHLILNHVPTVGTAIALGLLLLSLLRRNDQLTRVAFEVFCVVGLLTLPAYLSGVGTGQVLEKLPDVSKEAIARHHDGALVASFLMLLTAGAAWLGIWRFRRIGTLSVSNIVAVLLLSLVTLTMMAGTATMGGQIRHPEMMEPGAVPLAGPSWITALSVQRFVLDHTWVWPSCETLHFIGLWLLFGVIVLVNLRLMGMMNAAPFSAFHRLLPWAALGLGINLVTGMFWVIATPEQYMTNISFGWKMALLLLAGADLLYLTTFDGPWNVKEGQEAPALGKAMAVSAIALWIGVMYFGRMLPFIGNAF
jgi:uncharacterized membrane protein